MPSSSFPDAIDLVQRLRESGVHVHDNQRSWEEFDQFYEIVADFVEDSMMSSNASHFILSRQIRITL